MAQRVNQELLANLRPFIQQVIEEYASGGGTVTAGDNIDVVGDTVSLAEDVVIRAGLTIPDGASFYLYDADFDVVREIYFKAYNGEPHLVMSAGDEYEAYADVLLSGGFYDLFRAI